MTIDTKCILINNINNGIFNIFFINIYHGSTEQISVMMQDRWNSSVL